MVMTMSPPNDKQPRDAKKPDPLTPAQRRLNMSRIRSRNTKPERLLRSALHAAGFRYRLHDRKLPGTPDVVLPGRRAVIQVHGCFWHGHGCPRSVTPGANREFWVEKINRNCQRDATADAALATAGWRVFTVWECALTGPARRPSSAIIEVFRTWLATGERDAEIGGTWLAPPNL